MNAMPRIMGRGAMYFLLHVLALNFSCLSVCAADKHLRVNQVGYLPSDTKVAIVSTNDNLSGWMFNVIKVSDGGVVFGPQGVGSDQGIYCAFDHNYRLDFSTLTTPGTYKLLLSDGTSESRAFTIGTHAYRDLHEEILKFLRAQRSGYNPFIPATCHAPGAAGNLDAKCTDDNQVRDMSGGWYDAGDYIKFLVTTSNVLVLQLFAYNENKAKFADDYMADGTAGSNGIPDVLDEAKHGLDWILKMHPSASKLYYQVGDSRDHVGRSSWRLPQNDTVNYGLDGYRPAYHGIGANIAGRSAAALAMAYTIWKDDLNDETYANTCLAAAEELYTLAKQNLHAQGGTEGYYAETTFYDDLELAAIELYKANGAYLTEAQNYSSSAGSSWGWFDWGGINALAHYELYPHADAATKANLKTYLQQDLNENLDQANTNPFRVSTDYGWGSASVMTGTVVMCDLYKKLFPGETTYDALHDEVRDYILGKNQWDVSWVIGLGSNYTVDPHHQISYVLQKEATGTCIEGPMSLSEWNGMEITLADPDEYAEFQSSTAVYHDDVADWATNEPTIFQASLTLCALADMSPPLTVDVQDTISGTSPAYIGANEGGAFSVADLQDSGINLYRIWTTLGELEYYDDDWVADEYPGWPDYPSATYYGSPTIAGIKANTNLVPWSVWDSAFTASRWTGAVTFTTLLDGCQSAGLEPLLVLRAKGPDEGWIDWIPGAPDGDDFWQEWWEYCFAVAYWCNVRNSYAVTHFQVHNEPDLSSQGWTGTQAQYVQLIEYAHDALTFANNLASLQVHLHAPVVSNYASSYISYSLDNADTYIDAADYHVYDKYHDIPTSIQSVTQTVSAHNPDGVLEPVWITEWGDLDGNYDTVARAAATALQLVEFAEGGVEGSAIFMLYDWSTAGGLIASDSSKKESYYAHRLATRALVGGKQILNFSSSGSSEKVVVTRDLDGVPPDGLYVLAANAGCSVSVDISALNAGAGTAEIREYSSDYSDEVTGNATLADGVFTFTCPASGAASAFVSADLLDSDGDSLSDGVEAQYGSNPLATDSDGDGIDDQDETDWNSDTDNDGQINAMDVDSDDDGYTDYMEGFYGTSAVVSGEYPSILRVNFQPWSSTAPDGYLTDCGSEYSNGRAHGW